MMDEYGNRICSICADYLMGGPLETICDCCKMDLQEEEE